MIYVYNDDFTRRLEPLNIRCLIHVGRRYCAVLGLAEDPALVYPAMYGLKK